MNNLTKNDSLDNCLSTYAHYLSDARYLYKSCNFGTRIAVLILPNGSEHNENRYNIHNRRTAKHRASSVEVVCVFNKFNPTETFESGTSNFAGISTVYKTGGVTYADSFDKAISKDNSNGVYYFRCLEGAYYYGLLEMGTYTGNFFDWWANGQLKEVGQLVSGKREGKFEEFYENGKKCTVSYYVHGKLNGEYFEWFDNGNMSERGFYVNDNQVGPSISWHENGQKECEGCYNDEGLETGVWINWDELGYRTLFCTYKNGQYDGIYVKYASGSFNSVEVAGDYKDGVLNAYDLTSGPKFIF